MVPEHADLVRHRTDEERVIIRIPAARPLVLLLHRIEPLAIAVTGDPEILHHQDPVAVTCFVELRPFGEATAPDAYQVEVHVAVETDLGIIACGGQAQHGVRDDPVPSPHEDTLPVHADFAAPRCRVPDRCDIANAGGDRHRIEDLASVHGTNARSTGVQRLRAVPVRPPETGILHRDVRKTDRPRRYCAGMATSVLTVFPATVHRTVPATVSSVGFSISTVVRSVAGACGPSGKRTPGTIVTMCGSLSRTAPVSSRVTMSQIPVFLSRIGWIQSQPAVY